MKERWLDENLGGKQTKQCFPRTGLSLAGTAAPRNTQASSWFRGEFSVRRDAVLMETPGMNVLKHAVSYVTRIQFWRIVNGLLSLIDLLGMTITLWNVFMPVLQAVVSSLAFPLRKLSKFNQTDHYHCRHRHRHHHHRRHRLCPINQLLLWMWRRPVMIYLPLPHRFPRIWEYNRLEHLNHSKFFQTNACFNFAVSSFSTPSKWHFFSAKAPETTFQIILQDNFFCWWVVVLQSVDFVAANNTDFWAYWCMLI